MANARRALESVRDARGEGGFKAVHRGMCVSDMELRPDDVARGGMDAARQMDRQITTCSERETSPPRFVVEAAR